ncbi:hypothetical protein UAB78_004 [Escherichia phage UAB_Phi78]|uniref:Uncharacterized protein n=1 Tax=Escherichia phage UAB_Phi78 TaxID=979726 RepID=A0A9K0LKJ7_9CAUD|nr:hypothetical protein I132_gp04 [Escherichia phage UAB_Phi78]ADW95206.1 hypothetical protein UAB78_004 [Escherichia phage UAB_Phi78]
MVGASWPIKTQPSSLTICLV